MQSSSTVQCGSLNRPHPDSHYISISRTASEILEPKLGISSFSELRAAIIKAIADDCNVMNETLEWHYIAETEVSGQRLALMLVTIFSHRFAAFDRSGGGTLPFTTIVRGIMDWDKVEEIRAKGHNPKPRIKHTGDQALENDWLYACEQSSLDNATLLDIERHITDAESRRSDLGIEKLELQTLLSKLKNRVRTHRLSQAEYSEICNQQDDAKSNIVRIERDLRKLNRRIEYLKAQRKPKQEDSTDVRNDRSIRRKQMLLHDIWNLRDQYLSFSKDQTRVVSMRIMASQVAEELTSIIEKARKEA